MPIWLRRFFAAPVLADEDKTRVAGLLNVILNTFLAAGLLAPLVIFALSPDMLSARQGLLVAVVTVALTRGMRFLAYRGHVRAASLLLTLTLWASMTASLYGSRGTYQTGAGGGLAGADVSTFFVVIILAGLLLGGQALVLFAILSMLTTWSLWYMAAEPLVYNPVVYTILFSVAALLLRYAAASINQAIERARRNERAQAESNRELQQIRASLEQRVAERTASLERRTAQLQAATEVSHAVTAVLDQSRLARQVVELIREQFGLNFAGLFLTDDSNEQAALRAGAGAVGRALLERGCSLPLAGDSLVAQSILQAQARTVAETRDAAARVGETELPGVRSEAALPLRSRGYVIGALMVCSDQPAAFDPSTLAILEAVADQVAVSLDNARLFAQSQAALEATRRAYGELGRQAWLQLLRARPESSLCRDEQGFRPARREWQPQMRAALQSGQMARHPDDALAVAAPIMVRGQVIGVVDARKPDGTGAWTAGEITLVETLTEQLGVALESARLYQDTQHRAARERLAGQITARMRESLDVEAVLKTAASEIRQALELERVVVRLGWRPNQEKK